MYRIRIFVSCLCTSSWPRSHASSSRLYLTDLLYVVQSPSTLCVTRWSCIVGRALLRILRRWPHEFGGHWLGRCKFGRWWQDGPPELLTLLQSQLADARAELMSITEALSVKAATARVRRWRKWAQSVVSDQRKPAFQWAKGRDLVPLPTSVVVDGEMRADAQVLVDDEIGKWQRVGDDQCTIWW